MDAMVVFIVITLFIMDLCGLAYLGQLFMKGVYRMLDLKELLEKEQQHILVRYGIPTIEQGSRYFSVYRLNMSHSSKDIMKYFNMIFDFLTQ